MMNAVVMMLEWIGELDRSKALERAVRQVVFEGKVRTYDMGGSASTTDMARAVAKSIASSNAIPQRSGEVRSFLPEDQKKT
jgi:3-isopropylmalate dehydrogenase